LELLSPIRPGDFIYVIRVEALADMIIPFSQMETGRHMMGIREVELTGLIPGLITHTNWLYC
jgi:hypothetical protein